MNTETERAIQELTKASERGSFLCHEKDSLELAISSLKSQSEAERKIEKAIAECKKAISDIGHSQPYVDACEKILEILEGATE